MNPDDDLCTHCGRRFETVKTLRWHQMTAHCRICFALLVDRQECDAGLCHVCEDDSAGQRQRLA